MSLKIKAALACAVLTLSLGASIPAQSAKRLTVPDPDWTGGVVTCRTIQYVLENELDYKVKTIAIPGGPGVWEGIVAGDLFYNCETWPSYNPTKEKYLKEYGGDGSVTFIADSGIVGETAYWIPRYMVEGDSSRGIPASTPDLKTFADLNRYKHMFKSLESGDRGNLIGCPVAAWACEDQARMDAMGVDFYAQALGSETAHWAEIQAKYKRGEPFIAYAWAPHWIHAALDLVEVELPADQAWPDDVTFKFGNPALMAEYPDAVEVIRKHRLTNAQQAGMIYEIDVKKRDVDDVVAEWMEANPDVWQQWLP
jgi:glycine betaine/proline transport system substrate-binding protein